MQLHPQECKICGEEFPRLGTHVKKHDLNIKYQKSRSFLNKETLI